MLSMAKLYYIRVKDVERGPYVRTQLNGLWERAEITADALYYCEGMDDWKPLLEMMEENRESSPPVTDGPLSPMPSASPSAPVRRKDEVLFTDNSFTVTRTRFITPGQTYSIHNITSVKYTKSSPKYLNILLCVVFGLIIISIAVYKSVVVGIPTGVVIGAGEFFLIRAMLRPTYGVLLVTSSGEARALESKDKPYTGKIVSALNLAISQQ